MGWSNWAELGPNSTKHGSALSRFRRNWAEFGLISANFRADSFGLVSPPPEILWRLGQNQPVSARKSDDRGWEGRPRIFSAAVGCGVGQAHSGFRSVDGALAKASREAARPWRRPGLGVVSVRSRSTPPDPSCWRPYLRHPQGPSREDCERQTQRNRRGCATIAQSCSRGVEWRHSPERRLRGSGRPKHMRESGTMEVAAQDGRTAPDGAMWVSSCEAPGCGQRGGLRQAGFD